MLKKYFLYSCIYAFLIPTAFAASGYSQIDERLLFKPDPLQIKKETEGKVIIYDRVRESTINKALDKNFDRIEHMMFINTLIEKDNGELEEEYDGC